MGRMKLSVDGRVIPVEKEVRVQVELNDYEFSHITYAIGGPGISYELEEEKGFSCLQVVSHEEAVGALLAMD